MIGRSTCFVAYSEYPIFPEGFVSAKYAFTQGAAVPPEVKFINPKYAKEGETVQDTKHAVYSS